MQDPFKMEQVTPKKRSMPWDEKEEAALIVEVLEREHTVSHFSYAPLFQGLHLLTKMLESNILYNLLNDILSV